MARVLSIGFILLVFVFLTARAIATEELFAQAGRPSVLERAKDRIVLFFKFSQKEKVGFQKLLAEKRLAELKYAVDNNRLDLIEETSTRYAAYAGRLTNYLLKEKITSEKDSVLEMYARHSRILETLQGKYDYASEYAYWAFIEHDLNSLNSLAEKLNEL